MRAASAGEPRRPVSSAVVAVLVLIRAGRDVGGRTEGQRGGRRIR